MNSVASYRMPTIPSAPSCCACAIMRLKASSRAFSHTFSYSEILPPKIDFSPPVTFATTLVARTTRPRTTPLYSTIRYPAKSFDVVTRMGITLEQVRGLGDEATFYVAFETDGLV